MNPSAFLSFDADFPPTVMLGTPPAQARPEYRGTAARLSARATAWARVFALCAATGFFSGVVIAHLNTYLKQPQAPAQYAATGQPPATVVGFEQIPVREPFSVSWPVNADIEPALPATGRVVDSMRAPGDAGASGAARNSPLQALLVVLGAIGALGTAAVGAVNNWFAMLY